MSLLNRLKNAFLEDLRDDVQDDPNYHSDGGAAEIRRIRKLQSDQEAIDYARNSAGDYSDILGDD